MAHESRWCSGNSGSIACSNGPTGFSANRKDCCDLDVNNGYSSEESEDNDFSFDYSKSW